MTTYNTGNPLGSTAVKDLYDNAENLDHRENDLENEEWGDRFGVPRLTWYGIEKRHERQQQKFDDDFQQFLLNSGYEDLGDYDEGLAITSRNQVFRYDGELYRASAALELPYTTTGVWSEESTLFVAVGDGALRQELAEPDGASKVGLPNGTVLDAINYVTPQMFGAPLNGIDDDGPAIRMAAAKAFSEGMLLRANGAIRIASDVNLRRIAVDFESATVTLFGGAKLIIGGHASTTETRTQKFGSIVRNGGATSTPTVRMMGSKDQFVSIQACDYLQIYADTDVTGDSSIAYCTFNLGKIDKLELATNPAPVGSVIQWINENHFFVQRIADLIISGTYQHNHNKFYGGTFESGSKITFNVGRNNYIYGARFENGATVTLSAGTERNVIVNTWDSSTSNFDDVGATVIDEGFDNVVLDDFALYRHGETVASASINDTVLDTYAGSTAGRTPDLQRIIANSAAVTILDSEFLPVAAGDYFRWVSLGASGSIADTNARYRPRIEFYDAKLRPVPASLDFILTTGGVFSVVTGNAIGSGSNQSGAVAAILPAAIIAGVAFVKVKWNSNSPRTPSISQAVDLRIVRYTKDSDLYRGLPGRVAIDARKDAPVSGMPTKGFAPIGYTAKHINGSATYTCTLSVDTSLTAVAVSGATSVTVASAPGVDLSDIVGINLDDGTTHWTTVASVAGATVGIVNPIPSNAAANQRVVFVRWVTTPRIGRLVVPADSEAASLEDLVSDFNGLLANLRDANSAS